MDVLFTDYQSVLYRQSQTQHYQVCVGSVETVSVIGQEVLLVCPHELHDLVLALARGVGASENDAEALPVVVLFNFFLDEEVEHVIELFHEGSARRNGVVFEVFLTVSHVGVAVEAFDIVLIFLGTAETTSALVVHLAARGHSVEGHDDHLGGLDHGDDGVDVVEDFDPHFFEFFGHELRLEDDGVILDSEGGTLTHL